MVRPILSAILSCQGPYLSDEEKYLFEQYNPLGITLFGRNLENKEQLIKLINEIKNAINRDDVLIAIDEEGGRVSRLKNISDTKYVSAEDLSKEPLEYSKMHAELIAEEMRELGINVNYAPVVDKKGQLQNDVLAGRCFSNEDKKIIEYGSEIAKRYIEMGICPCIKHIPGHFGATKDPHLSLIENNWSWSDIEKNISYLKSFKDFPLGMTSHILLKSIDENTPVSMSKKIISEVIRGYLEFDSFLITDAIDMHALPGTMVEKTRKCLDAGVDAICYCAGKYEVMQNICKEQRFLTEKSLIRFAKIKNIIHNVPKCIDMVDIKKRYDTKFQNVLNVEYSYDATEVLHQMLKKGEK